MSRRTVIVGACAVVLAVVPLAGAVPPAAPTITSGPTGATGDNTPTFTFTSAGATGYTCSIAGPTAVGATACDGGTFTAPALADGAYTFSVTAGNVDGASAPATRTFTVDTTAPAAPTIASGPTGTTGDNTPTFTFSSAGATGYTCSIAGPTAVGATACDSGTFTAPALADGAYTFSVTASDPGGTSAPATRAFAVDATPPPTPTIAGPTGTINDATPTFTFTSTGASSFRCSVDAPTTPTAACSSPFTPAAPLADGPHTFYVTASDSAGNTSAAASQSFTVDRTPPPTPTITGPTGATKETTPAFSFTSAGAAGFACSIDAPTTPTAACSSPFTPAAPLADGPHTFYVTASDAAGNTSAVASQSFTVDSTKPVLSGPGNLVAEADGPNGTRVSFTVSATDGSPPVPLIPGPTCTPASASQFGLGRTTVTCTAKDAVGNIGTLGFTVTVADTRPPSINAPDVSFTATGADGIASTAPPVVAYLTGISASDLVSSATISVNPPAVFPIGTTTLVVSASDAAGNTATKNVTVTVLRPGTPAPPVDLTPPKPVTGARAKAGDHQVTLTWTRPKQDVARVEIRQSVVGKAGAPKLIYSGLAQKFVSKGLVNGATYRFVLTVVDAAGNSSPSVVVNASPAATFLTSPRAGGVVTSPPLLRWAPVPATYFNVQLYRSGSKVLSAWPTRARLQLTSTWTYNRRTYRLSPGVYTWYVWPGRGQRSEARYGDLLGRSSFVVAARKK